MLLFFCGALLNTQVIILLELKFESFYSRDYHFLPSKSENFGHSHRELL